MPFESTALSIPDIKLITFNRNYDARGYFAETYNQKALARIGIGNSFIQDNESLSLHRGVVRGLHFQSAPNTQAKLVRVLRGSIYDVAVDVRLGSPTYSHWCGATLSSKPHQQMFIPAGFAHGYCTLESNTIVAYKVDGYYAKECEGGVRWNDPDLAIDWPISPHEALTSEKDRALPLLRDFSSPFTYEP